MEKIWMDVLTSSCTAFALPTYPISFGPYKVYVLNETYQRIIMKI
jgi:hypothetical protein